MAKALEVTIKANDQASATFEKVADKAESTTERFEKGTKVTRGLTEVTGQLSSTLGETGQAFEGVLGKFSGILGGLEELSTSMDEAGQGTLGLKIGLAALVAYVSFEVGRALGDMIFQTREAANEMKMLAEEAERLDSQLLSASGERFARDLADLEKIEDLEQRRLAAMEKQATVDTDIASKKAQVKRLTEEISQRTETMTGMVAGLWGEYAKTTEEKERQLELAKGQLEQLREQSQALAHMANDQEAIAEAAAKEAEERQKLVDASNQRVTALQDELDLLTAADKIATKIAQMTRDGELLGEDAANAERIMRAIEAEKQRQKDEAEAEKERVKLAEQAAAEAKKEAEKIRDEAQKQEEKRLEETTLSLKENRLLSKGDSTTAAPEKTAENTRKIAEDQKVVIEKLERLAVAFERSAEGEKVQWEPIK